jgi:hypothetical protein
MPANAAEPPLGFFVGDHLVIQATFEPAVLNQGEADALQGGLQFRRWNSRFMLFEAQIIAHELEIRQNFEDGIQC